LNAGREQADYTPQPDASHVNGFQSTAVLSVSVLSTQVESARDLGVVIDSQ